MFQSYTFKQCLGEKDDKYSFEYELVDSEFGTVSGVGVVVGVGVCVRWSGGAYDVEVGVGVVVGNTYEVEVGIAFAVIQEYGKRKLNVGKNLAVAFAWYSRQDPKSLSKI